MITALVMAAGASRRMGKVNKMLLPYKGSTVLNNTIEIFRQSCVDHIIVVLGCEHEHEHEHVRAAVCDNSVDFVIHNDWNRGQATSPQYLKILRTIKKEFVTKASCRGRALYPFTRPND